MTALKRAEAGVRNADVAEAMGMTEGLLRRWTRDNHAVIGLQTVASDRAAYIVSAVKFLRLSLQTSVYAVGASLAIQQHITPGIMFAAALLMARALSPVESAIATWRNLLAARAAYRRLHDMMTRAPARQVAMVLPPPQGNLSIERVVYVPPGSEAAVLKGVSLDLDAGQILGIIVSSSVPGNRPRAQFAWMRPMSIAGSGRISAATSAICPRISSCSPARSRRTSPALAMPIPNRSSRPPSSPACTR
jgi:ABC-type protease/lipase transport system fused ATPase/permease subunit